MQGRFHISINRKIVLSALIFCANSAVAQDHAAAISQLAEQCTQIRDTAEGGFQGRALARPLADDIEVIAQDANESGRLATILSAMNDDATGCVAYARQLTSGAIFDPQSNRFVSTGTARAQEAALRRLEEEALDALAKAEVNAQAAIRRQRQEALENEVNARVYKACSELSLNDPTTAYTNLLCVQSFKENGLPEQ